MQVVVSLQHSYCKCPCIATIQGNREYGGSVQSHFGFILDDFVFPDIVQIAHHFQAIAVLILMYVEQSKFAVRDT